VLPLWLDNNKEKLYYFIILLTFFLFGCYKPQYDNIIWQEQINILLQLSLTSLGLFGIFIIFYINRDLTRRDEIQPIFNKIMFGTDDDLPHISFLNIRKYINDEAILNWYIQYKCEQNKSCDSHQQNENERIISQINKLIRYQFFINYIRSLGVEPLNEDEQSSDHKVRLQYTLFGLVIVLLFALFMFVGYSLLPGIFENIPYGINLVSGIILAAWIGFILSVGNFAVFLFNLITTIPIRGQYVPRYHYVLMQSLNLQTEIKLDILKKKTT